MTTAHLALRQIVTSPLKFPKEWGDMMGNFDFKGWAPTILSGTLFIMGCIYAAGGNWGSQSKDIQALQAQNREFSVQLEAVRTQIAPLSLVPAQLARLTSILDAAPRADMLESRLSEIQRHLSALDGRGDATETRIRADEDRAIRDATRLDAIEKGSITPLGNRH
jgi:outer membrane murein-binding lipoprotein Lpp